MYYRNKKNRNIYTYVGTCINCTNAQDGQIMIIYRNEDKTFVREEKEFHEKFEKVELKLNQ